VNLAYSGPIDRSADRCDGGSLMLLRSAVRVAAMAVGTTFVGVIGVLLGISGANVTTAVVMRTVLVVALVLAMTRAFRIRDRSAADHAARPLSQVLIAAGLAYLVNPFSWGGHTLFGQLLVSAGVFSAVIDFVVWMAVAISGVLLGQRARVKATATPTPYA